MTVREIMNTLSLTLFSGTEGLDNTVTGGYTSDLLSDVMGHAQAGQLWITLQTHANVLAIASLKELSAVVLVSGCKPDEGMLAHARSEHVPVLGSELGTFELSGRIYNLLIN